MSSLIRLSNENLLKRIESVKENINELYIENKIFASDHCTSLSYYNTHMNHYQRELQELEMEKQKRIQQLPICKKNLSKAVLRDRSRNAVRTLLTRPHYSQIPNIPNSQSGFLRYLSPTLGKTKTESMLNSIAGDRGIARSILNYLTGDDLLPTNQRVYLRHLQESLNELPEELLLKIWNNLSNKTRLSNIRENSDSSDEPIPETGGRKRNRTKRNRTKRNKTKRNKTKRNRTKRNKNIL